MDSSCIGDVVDSNMSYNTYLPITCPATESAADVALLVEIQASLAPVESCLVSGCCHPLTLASDCCLPPATCQWSVAGGSVTMVTCRKVLGRLGGPAGGGGILTVLVCRLPLLDELLEISVSVWSVLVVPFAYSQHGKTMWPEGATSNW